MYKTADCEVFALTNIAIANIVAFLFQKDP